MSQGRELCLLPVRAVEPGELPELPGRQGLALPSGLLRRFWRFEDTSAAVREGPECAHIINSNGSSVVRQCCSSKKNGDKKPSV